MSSDKNFNDLGQTVGEKLLQWQPPPFPLPVIMPGRYCRLEPLNPESHAEGLHASNNGEGSAGMWTYLPYGPFPTFESYRTWVGEMCVGSDPQFYAIIDPGDDTPVGVASYLRIDPANGVLEIGHLAYSPRMQRSVIATEAIFLLLQRAFGLGYRRCEWKCNAHNMPSRAAAQRLGFSYEGLFRQASVVKGRNRDTAWYAMIDKEWHILKDVFTTWLAPRNFDGLNRQRTSLSALTRPYLQQIG